MVGGDHALNDSAEIKYKAGQSIRWQSEDVNDGHLENWLTENINDG